MFSDGFEMRLDSYGTHPDDVPYDHLRSVLAPPGSNVTQLRFRTTVLGTFEYRRRLEDVQEDPAVGIGSGAPDHRALQAANTGYLLSTTVSGRFPYTKQPPAHIQQIASLMNMSVNDAGMGFRDCVLTEAIQCPAGTHHNPALLNTFSEDDCLGCPVGTAYAQLGCMEPCA